MTFSLNCIGGSNLLCFSFSCRAKIRWLWLSKRKSILSRPRSWKFKSIFTTHPDRMECLERLWSTLKLFCPQARSVIRFMRISTIIRYNCNLHVNLHWYYHNYIVLLWRFTRIKMNLLGACSHKTRRLSLEQELIFITGTILRRSIA